MVQVLFTIHTILGKAGVVLHQVAGVSIAVCADASSIV